jgi:type II secretory pathway component PulF
MKTNLKKKGGLGLGDIYPAVLTFVLIGIVLGIGLYVMAEVMDEISDHTAGNAVNDTITALASFADWFAIIVIVLAAAIIIGLVMRSFRQ